MVDISNISADYYNPDINGYIWPDSSGQPCFYCGNITVWTVVANPDDAIDGRLKTKCCSKECLDKYKAEAALSIVSNA